MTGFYSTAEESTAYFGASSTLIDWSPAVINMTSSLDVYAGGIALCDGEMTLNADLHAYGGVTIPIDVELSMTPSSEAHGGALIEFDPIDYFFSIEPMSVYAGASIPFVNDVSVYDFGSTSEFSTAMPLETSKVIRVQHTMSMSAPLSIQAGTTLILDGQMEFAPTNFDPVARPHKVRTQLIVS